MSRRGIWRSPHDVLASLAGSWSLSRLLDNGASMNGFADFAARGNGQYDYYERGQLRLVDGRTVEGERRYIFEEAGGGFMVWFAESPPRLFHHISLSSAGRRFTGSGVHLCAEDRYDSLYEFHCDGAFTVNHAVRGPRKHYTISTRYCR